MRSFLALSLWLSTLRVHVLGFSLQSGPENGGDSVAGDVSYDSSSNLLYITGATDGSFFGEGDPSNTNCFLASIKLDTPDDPWWSTRQLGNADVAESCSTVLPMAENDKLFVGGASLEGGVLSELRARGSLRSTVFGMVMQLSLSATNAENAFALEGGNLLHEAYVQYPIAMDRDSDYIYVASIISEDVTENPYYEPFAPQSYGYGSQFSAKVQRLAAMDAYAGDDALQETLVPSWQREIGTSSSVFVGGILYMNGSSLLLVGSTQGWDSAFPDTTPGNDYDGFITEMDPTTGQLTANSYRIESQPPGRDDRAVNVCKQQGNENIFYVVGVTTGNLGSNDERDPTQQAFIAKFEVVTTRGLSMEWVRQIGANAGNGSAGVQGLACAVTPKGEAVYMVGRVDSGATISGIDAASSGGTDAFVMQLDTAQGATNYIRQFGSDKDDYVTDVETVANGDAIVYGTTTGSLYREVKENEQDIFVVSFSHMEGAFDQPLTGGSTTDSGAGATPTEPATAPPTNAPADAPAPPPVDYEGPAEPANPDGGNNVAAPNNQGDSDDGGRSTGSKVAIAVIVMSVVALASFFVYRRVSYGKDLYYSDEDHVVNYLKGFDDVEVDLKHSATGGWHGTYLNPRYQSSDNYSYNSETTDTSVRFDANSSYVRDSLFMDDYDAPSLGPQDDEMSDEREGLTRQRSNYDGLLDAYNTTWDELSPHVMPTATRPSPKRDLSNKKHVMETIDFMKDDDAWGKEII